jgi:hypothetical protein
MSALLRFLCGALSGKFKQNCDPQPGSEAALSVILISITQQSRIPIWSNLNTTKNAIFICRNEQFNAKARCGWGWCL